MATNPEEAVRPISRTNESFSDLHDFDTLRTEGIAHCQALAGEIWTDYNLHDPGLTILEVLCYALTDLQYRTSFEPSTLFARSDAHKRNAATADDRSRCLPPRNDNFFSPAEILTCNPVTLLDLRRLLIDIPGVRNAWLTIADRSEVDFHVVGDEEPTLAYATEDNANDDTKVVPDGLYEVSLELDDSKELDPCGEPILPVERILADVHCLLHQYRNLCEDFLDVVVLQEEDIALCGDIELKPDADPEDVFLEIYQRVVDFLSPEIKFYTLEEMLAKGKSIDEIYAGRPMAPLGPLDPCNDHEPPLCSHGFIDSDDLEATDLRTEIHMSDLYNVIMSIPEVAAIHNLLGVNYINKAPMTTGEPWCLHLTEKHRPRFDLDRSKINLSKGPITLAVDIAQVKKRFIEEREANTKSLLTPDLLNQTAPEDRHRADLGTHYSVMHDFPMVYAIGDGELGANPTAERTRQVQRLRAYLLFFDQLLANYLAQLGHVRDIFSMQPDSKRAEETRRVLFAQALLDFDENNPGGVPEVDTLLRNYRCNTHESDHPGLPDDYPPFLDFVTESPEEYTARRNRVLDHLLARFAESFTEYTLLMLRQGGEDTAVRLIEDKARFLNDYAQLSHDRGRGYTYLNLPDCGSCGEQTSDELVWDTDNVSGLEHRVTRLLGLQGNACAGPDAGPGRLRRTLAPTEIVEIDGGWVWRIELSGSGDTDETVTFTGRQRHARREDAQTELTELRKRLSHEANIARLTHKDADGSASYSFAVVDDEHNILLDCPETWPKSADRERYLFALMRLILGGSMQLNVLKPDECWFFDLYDKDTHLLRGMIGECTKSGAEEAYDHTFVPAARNHNNYRHVGDANKGYGFAIDLGNETKLAESAQTYTTPEERELAKLRVWFLIAQPELKPRIAGKEGSYRFAVRQERGDTLLFESTAAFVTETEAEAGYELFEELAHLHSRYRDILLPDSDAPYGLELTYRDGTTLARHPTGYKTEEERDAARNWLVRLFCPVLAVRTSIREEDKYFNVSILTEADFPGDTEEELLVCSLLIDNHRDAKAALDEMLEAAGEAARYALFERNGQFGFELRDKQGDLLATHPHLYPSAILRDRAMHSVAALVQPASVNYDIDGLPGEQRFFLLDPYPYARSGEPRLFRSAGTYPDEAAAIQAYEHFLEVAKDPNNYRPTVAEPNLAAGLNGTGQTLSFDVYDGETHIASFLHFYEFEAERKAAKDMVLALMNPGQLYVRYRNPTAAYRFQILGELEKPLLVGTSTQASAAKARIARRKALALARRPDRYVKLGEPEDGPCPYAVGLNNKHDRLVATSPIHARTDKEQDALRDHIYAWVHDASSIVQKPNYETKLPEHDFKLVTENNRERFHYRIVDVDGTPLLDSTTTYNSPNEARAAYHAECAALVVSRSNYHVDYTGCVYSFDIRNAAGKVLASYPESEETRKAIERVIDRLLALAQSTPVSREFEEPVGDSVTESQREAEDCVGDDSSNAREDVIGLDCGFYFALTVDDLVLTGNVHYPSRSEAARAGINLLPELIRSTSYSTVKVDDELVQLTVPGASAVPEKPQSVEYTKRRFMQAVRQTNEGAFKVVERWAELRCRTIWGDGEVFTSTSEAGNDGFARIRGRAVGFRTSILLEGGMEEAQRYFNATPEYKLINLDGAYAFTFQISDNHRLVGRWRYASKEAAEEAANALVELGKDSVNIRALEAVDKNDLGYEIFDAAELAKAHEHVCDECIRFNDTVADDQEVRSVASDCGYAFELASGVWRPSRLLPSAADAQEMLAQIRCQLNSEGFHLVEHLLLRPKERGDTFVPLGGHCRDDEGNLCPVRSDPYSFRISVIVPVWPERFRDIPFRRFFEQTLRQETPAHILPRICWVQICDMQKFEKAYRQWLVALANPNDDCALDNARAELINILFNLSSVQPAAYLGGEKTTEAPFRLDQSSLGTARNTS